MGSFRIYQIVCIITDQALVYGSDCPHDHRGQFGRAGEWYMRGHWSDTGGCFWKTENTVRKHLQNLCHDWTSHYENFPRYRHWRQVVPNSLDWSRLEHLRVQQILVTNHSSVTISGADFMGINASRVA